MHTSERYDLSLFNKAARAARLSLFDTLETCISNARFDSLPRFSKNMPRPQCPGISKCVCASFRVVGLGGLEPPASPLSGVRSNHLSYRPKMCLYFRWWSLSGSNRRPPACKAGALPAELRPRLPRDTRFPVESRSLNAGHLCGRLAMRCHVSKGGDPAAPSDTATLLRLHPSHRPHRGKRPPEG